MFYSKPVPKLTAKQVEKMLSKVSKPEGEEGCWIWTGCMTGSKSKRPGITINKLHYYAHRVIYTHFVGIVPSHLTIDHICCNVRCVNPKHLQILPLKDNILRGNSKSAVNARKAKCIKCNGEFTQYKFGRVCRNCVNKKAKERTLQKRLEDGLPLYVPTGSRTHCPQGHEYTISNTIKDMHGWRKCRTCHYAKNRERQRRKKK